MININLKNFSISNNSPFVLIAGPCVIENESHSLMIAEQLHKICDDVGINLIFKSSFDKANRSSINSDRGIKLDEALKIGERISILRDGSIVQDDNPQKIILNPSDKYVSDFIKDINRSRVIKAKSIMIKSISIKKENVPIIDSEMVLEEVLQEITKTKYYFVYVKDNKNKIIGKITLKQLLNGIQRPRQENKKYA